MGNLVQWIEEAANGEPVVAVVWQGDYDRVEMTTEWDREKGRLDREFDHGHGLPGCPAVCAWTSTRVIFVDQYDGATSICWVPRHPAMHLPIMPGGGALW